MYYINPLSNFSIFSFFSAKKIWLFSLFSKKNYKKKMKSLNQTTHRLRLAMVFVTDSQKMGYSSVSHVYVQKSDTPTLHWHFEQPAKVVVAVLLLLPGRRGGVTGGVC